MKPSTRVPKILLTFAAALTAALALTVAPAAAASNHSLNHGGVLAQLVNVTYHKSGSFWSGEHSMTVDARLSEGCTKRAKKRGYVVHARFVWDRKRETDITTHYSVSCGHFNYIHATEHSGGGTWQANFPIRGVRVTLSILNGSGKTVASQKFRIGY